MTLNEYKAYALAKKQIEYHSFNPLAKYQCVDLANDYITKVWELEAIIGTDAKDFPERLKPGMEYVENTPDYLPKPGEVAVWDGDVGKGAGHISVVLEKGSQLKFKSLDQNWSKPLYVTEETHSYNNVRGFIRKTGGTMPETIQVEKAVFEQLVTKATKYDEIVKTGYVTKADHDKRVDELNAQNNSHINEITALQKENAQLKQDLEDCESHEPDTEPVGWVKNGLTKEEVVGGTKWITNYKRA